MSLLTELESLFASLGYKDDAPNGAKCKLWNLLRKDRLEDDLTGEPQFHPDRDTGENIVTGMSPKEARSFLVQIRPD
jgi:hypothetical protein